MSYNNWTSRTESLGTDFKWYSLSQLIKHVQQVRNNVLQLSIQQRGDTGPFVAPPTVPCPVRQNQRFPGNELFVCDALGDWGHKIDELQLMYSILRNPIKLERRYSNITSLGDVDFHILVTASVLLKDAEQQHTVIDRAFFEARYCLQWEDKP